MGKGSAKGGRKKRRPLVDAPMKSMRRARDVTSKFHVLTQEQTRAKASGDKAAAAQAAAQLEALGGRDAYQQASILTTTRSKHTSKWLFSTLTRLGARPKSGQRPLRTLEVGAVNTQLLVVPWLDVLAVDINSQHPSIRQADFFDLEPTQEYRVVMCSMVINCVPTAAQRGRMLRGLFGHLQPGGFLFLMLPLRCLTHSPHTTWSSFVRILERPAADGDDNGAHVGSNAEGEEAGPPPVPEEAAKAERKGNSKKTHFFAVEL